MQSMKLPLTIKHELHMEVLAGTTGSMVLDCLSLLPPVIAQGTQRFPGLVQ
jgi:hypothetical protein